MNSSHQSERSVVITGVGVVSPVGIGVDAFWASLEAGKSGIGVIDAPYTALPHKMGAMVPDFKFKDIITDRDQRKRQKVMCREIEMGVASSRLALTHAGIDKENTDRTRLGVEFGAGLMMSPPSELEDGVHICTNNEAHEFKFDKWGDRTDGGLGKMDPLWLLKYLPNMPACHITINEDAQGPSNSLTMDESAGMNCISEAVRIIGRGHADVMIAGSTGTHIHPIKSIRSILWGIFSLEGICRPFDVRRSGEVAGEGSGSLILEEESHAVGRGAKILGKILGAGVSCGISPQGRPDFRRALVLAMKSAFRDAGLTPADIGHINADGYGSPELDLAEAQAIHEIFGRLAPEIPVTALKSVLGNSGAGCGLLEFAGSLIGLQHGVVPATLNSDQTDPACNLRVVTQPLAVKNKTFLKLSATREGQGAAIIARAT